MGLGKFVLNWAILQEALNIPQDVQLRGVELTDSGDLRLTVRARVLAGGTEENPLICKPSIQKTWHWNIQNPSDEEQKNA